MGTVRAVGTSYLWQCLAVRFSRVLSIIHGATHALVVASRCIQLEVTHAFLVPMCMGTGHLHREDDLALSRAHEEHLLSLLALLGQQRVAGEGARRQYAR